MKQLQITVPKKSKEKVKEVLENYSSDVSSSEAEKKEEKVLEFTVTVDSDQIDDLTEELKGLEGIDSGDLSIRVIKQESLISKGQETKGSNSMLSNEELYSKAKESATFNRAQWSLIAISSVVASYGLVSDNIIVVIGAMMLAPILSPFVSSSLSINVGDRKLMRKAIKTGVLSAFLAVVASFIAVTPFSVQNNALITLVSSTTVYGVLLSILVGIAAALTFATGFRDQVAGVAVAVAIVPPLAAAGIGLRIMDPSMTIGALTVASMNMSAVLVASFVTFRFLGLKPSTYYKKKQAQKIQYLVPIVLVLFMSLAFHTTSIADEPDSLQVENTAEDILGSQLLETRTDDTGTLLYVVGDFNETEVRKNMPEDLEIGFVRLESNN